MASIRPPPVRKVTILEDVQPEKPSLGKDISAFVFPPPEGLTHLRVEAPYRYQKDKRRRYIKNTKLYLGRQVRRVRPIPNQDAEPINNEEPVEVPPPRLHVDPYRLLEPGPNDRNWDDWAPRQLMIDYLFFHLKIADCTVSLALGPEDELDPARSRKPRESSNLKSGEVLPPVIESDDVEEEGHTAEPEDELIQPHEPKENDPVTDSREAEKSVQEESTPTKEDPLEPAPARSLEEEDPKGPETTPGDQLETSQPPVLQDNVITETADNSGQQLTKEETAQESTTITRPREEEMDSEVSKFDQLHWPALINLYLSGYSRGFTNFHQVFFGGPKFHIERFSALKELTLIDWYPEPSISLDGTVPILRQLLPQLVKFAANTMAFEMWRQGLELGTKLEEYRVSPSGMDEIKDAVVVEHGILRVLELGDWYNAPLSLNCPQLELLMFQRAPAQLTFEGNSGENVKRLWDGAVLPVTNVARYQTIPNLKSILEPLKGLETLDILLNFGRNGLGWEVVQGWLEAEPSLCPKLSNVREEEDLSDWLKERLGDQSAELGV